jgi:hypothetical protein
MRKSYWVIVFSLCVFPAMVFAADMEIKPYGFILTNAEINDHVATDIPVTAALADTGDARASFLLTARQTRFGLKMSQPGDVWTVKGQIELDFWGLKGSGKNGASMQSAPRLRMAFLALTKKDVTFTFGQDWSIFAPLNPTSLAHVSIPALSGSGNLWNRFPQLRLDYTHALQGESKILFQIAAVRPIAADTTTVSQTELLGAGEYNVLPFGQARLAYSSGTSFTIGAGAHFGQENWDKAYPAGGYTDDKTTSFAVAGDLKVKADVVEFSGEGFVGSNLPMLFSNAFKTNVQTIVGPDTLIKVDGVDVMGGWGEVLIKPKNSKVSFAVGAGIEILDEDQVDSMVVAASAPVLSQNLTAYGNVSYVPLPKVTLGLEIGYISTTYKYLSGATLAEADGTNLNVNTAFKLDF